jgi:hypothetical protein
MSKRASMDGTQASGTQGGGVRDQYRTLEAHLHANIDSLTRTDNATLKERVEEAGEIFRTSRDGEANEVARNSALDSRIILLASQLGTIQAGNLNKCSPVDFLRKIRTRYGNVNASARKQVDEAATQAEQDAVVIPLNWAHLAMDVKAVFHRVVPWDSPWEASGLSIPEKERKARAARIKDVLEAEVRPQQLSADDVNNVTEATQKRRCETMFKTINTAAANSPVGAVNFYHLVLNSERRDGDFGFGQTIENLFDFSFLLKEGHVQLEIDQKSGEPMAKTRTAPNSADYRDGVAKVQNILKLDKPTWEELCARYGKHQLLPTRPRGGGAAGPSAAPSATTGGKRARS